jgi:outer membrane lipoprotein-sorting protein
MRTCVVLAIGVLASAAVAADEPADPEQRARELVAAAIDLTRGTTSYCELSMVIHRPDWERRSSLIAWTRGRDDALIRFTAPPRDAGNATLKSGPKMWTFTPKLNRVIRLPYSMMAQDWAGSDFSYNDLSRTDILLTDYRLELIDEKTVDGHVVYTIRATPHDDAPVVWGREEMVLRDDYVLQEQTFFDQALVPLKRLEALTVGELGGRTFATSMRMVALDKPDQYTEMTYEKASFDIPLDDGLFTVFALKSGRAP